MSQELEQQRTANVVLTADVDPYRQSIQAAGNETTKLTTQVDKLTKSLDTLAKSAGKKMTFFGLGTAAGVTATTVAFAAFDKQMTALKVNAEVTGRSYEKMVRNVNDLRKTFGVSTASAVELNRVIFGFKDSTAPVNKLAETFVRLGSAVGEAPEALAQGMLQLQRSMGTSQRDTDRYSNVLADLSIKSGVAASSIVQFSQAIAPIGRIAGMQQAEVMGVATAFNKAGQDGYLAANAFNSMLGDIMQATQAGSPDLAKYSNLIGVTVDQFKQMGKTEAITRVFDELNRLGPDAIQILNRMGLDGMRMQRAIAGVSQQSGGIGTAVAQAVAAYNTGGDNALKKGSDVALNGLSDQMGRLAESTKQLGESMGAAFEGPAKGFVTVLEKIVGVVNALARSPLGQLAAQIGGLVGGAMALGGPLIAGAGTLMSLAMARQATNNWMTKGIRDRFTERTTGFSTLHPMSQAGRDVADGRAHWGQRMLYNLGYGGIGRALPAIAPGEAGYPSRGIGVLARTGAFGLNVLSGSFTGLQHPFDPTKRVSIFATPQERAAGGGWGPGGIFSSGVTSGAGQGSQGLVTRSALLGRRLATLPFQNTNYANAGWFSGAAPNIGKLGEAGLRFTGAAAGATAGLVGVAGNMALRGVGSMIGGMGPLGLAMLGIPLGMAAKSAIDSRNKIDVGQGADNISLMSAYKAAVGEATTATMDFATALKNSMPDAPPTKRQALIVSEQDKIAVQQNSELTNKDLAGMPIEQAANLLSGQIRNGASPKAIQALKLDLMREYGYDKAERVLAAANGRRGFSVDRYVAGLDASSDSASSNTWFGVRADKTVDAQYGLLEGQFKDQRVAALAQGGSAAGGEVQKVLTNQFLSSFFKRYRSMGSGEQDAGERFINEVLFGGKIDIGTEGNQTAANTINRLVDWQQFAVDSEDVYEAFKKGTTPGLQEFYGQMAGTDHKGTKQAWETFIGNQGLTRKMAAEQIKTGRGSLFNTDMNTAKLLMGSSVTAAEATQMRIFNNDAGQVFQGNKKVMDAINTAIATPGNQNNQILAVDQMVNAMKKSGMSFGEIERALIEFQGAVQSTSDPLFQLAAAARSVNTENLQYKLPYMARSDQFSAVGFGYAGTMVATAPQEGKQITPEAQQERKRATREWEAYKLNIRNTYMQMLTQQREFDISRERSNYDFYQVQLPRMEDQFNLSRERAWEDYHISRERSETEFAISRARSAQQFGISQKDALFDYNLSRKRAEEDFHHQQVLMAKQAAQSMYDVYQRTLVQRTWAGPGLLQNSQDQLRRMREQNANLDKARQMGLSKLAIQQLGFTDAANAQQLARFLEDAMRNPQLIGQFNKNAKQRLKAGKELATDPANPQWEEMRRQFRLTMSRGADDFDRAMARNRRNYRISMNQSQADFSRAMDNNAADMKRAMARSATDYGIALANMKSDYARQQDRAAKDLKRAQRELTWSFEEVLEKAVKRLAGQAGTQAQIIKDLYDSVRQYLKANQLEVIVNWKQSPGRTRFTDPMDRNNKASRTSAYGGVYGGSQTLNVGEAGPELVLPLDGRGAEFVASLMHRYGGDAKRAQVHRNPIPTNNATYNYRVDQSMNFTGPVQVSGVQNLREIAEQARTAARHKALTKGVRH